MRLIDVDALIQKVKEEEDERHLDKDTTAILQFLIDEYAEPGDAVPVIRCKNCKYLNDYVFPDGTLHLCEQPNKEASHVIDNLERFCSWAERKEK